MKGMWTVQEGSVFGGLWVNGRLALLLGRSITARKLMMIMCNSGSLFLLPLSAGSAGKNADANSGLSVFFLTCVLCFVFHC
jgi:hypothetical protein